MMDRRTKFTDFEVLAENSPLAVYLVGPEGYFRYVNKKVCEISGYSRDELLNMKWTKLVHPEFREFMLGQVEKRFRQQGALPKYEFKAIDRYGNEIYMEGHFSLVDIGGDTCILGQVLDISDRIKMEIELKRREESLRRVLDTSNLGYFEVDIAGNFLYLNEALAKMFGYPKEELIGMNNREYTEPEEAKKVYKVFNKVYREEKPATFFDWKITTKNGKEIFVETSVDLIYNEKGEKIGFRGIVRDITKEREIKKELEKREKYYRTLFEGSASPTIIVDGYKIVDVNKAFEEFSGYSRVEIIGKLEWTKFVDEKDLPRMLEYHQKRQIDPQSVPSMYEFVFIDRNKNKKDVLIIVTYLPDGNFLASLLDISERKKLEEKLRFISFHDPLTGLYNRLYFEEEFSRLENCRCLPVALVIADLDGLKYVNDTFGHKVGDEYIKSCANILRSCVRKSDVVARLGGDEFGIILPKSDEQAVRKVISRINDAIFKFNKEKKEKFKVSISMGFAVTSTNKIDKEKLFRDADNAMYLEKQRRKQRKEYICMR